MNKFIDRVVKLPIAVKLAIIVAGVALLTGANWFFFISDFDQQISSNKAKIAKLEKDLVDKKNIADDLNKYRKDKEILERKLAEALTELPATKEIDELLRQLNDVGKKSGLEIVSLEPGVEKIEGFYASIPIKMLVSGSYHEIAVFFESVSKLRRIVNISNLSFASPASKNEKMILSASYTATTFRFVDPSEVQPAKGKGKGKGK